MCISVFLLVYGSFALDLGYKIRMFVVHLSLLLSLKIKSDTR